MGENYQYVSVHPYGKLYFYEQILKVPTYLTYHPPSETLEVRILTQGSYVVQEANENGRFWIPGLELNIGMWYGERLGQEMNWLRWWDSEGNLLLWSSEQAEIERQRAEEEKARAEEEKARAEEEKARAEEEKARAEEEKARAEEEKARAELLAAKLRELGIDPNQL